MNYLHPDFALPEGSSLHQMPPLPVPCGRPTEEIAHLPGAGLRRCTDAPSLARQ